MEQLPQQIVNGLVLGCMYALIALGYTMVYGIIKLINFAHGEVLMMGALTSWMVIEKMNAAMPQTPAWVLLLVAMLVACIVCAALNFAIEKIAYRPLRNSPRLAPLITAIGMSLLLQALAMIIWKPEPKAYYRGFAAMPYTLGSVSVTMPQILILVVTGTLLSLLVYLVSSTKIGRAMRATAESPKISSLMGVNPDTVISVTFIIGAVLAAIAGVMNAMYYGTVSHTMGFLPGMKAFSAAVFGGIGNLPGAVLGGLLMGLIEAIGGAYLGPLTHGFLGSHYTDILSFVVLIVTLLFRPTGLLGERVADRA